MRALSIACALLLGAHATAMAEEPARANSDAEAAPITAPAKLAPVLSLQAIENRTWGAGRLVKGKRAAGKVAFTFDDGPDLVTTPLILDALEQFDVPATFFVVGRRFANENGSSRAGAELLREIADRGFTIGNHTSRHHRLDNQSYRRGKESIARNAEDIAEILGAQPRLFRPPFGATTREIRSHLRQRGDTLVMWSIDPRDFKRTPDKVLRRRVVQQILRGDGGVIVLHDTKPWTARILPGVLKDLEAANCKRLKQGRVPVLPVSLHYFMRDPDGSPRPIPPETVNITQKALSDLKNRCQNGH